MEQETAQQFFFMMLLLFLALFFIVEALIEKKKPGFGHTTGIIVILGILVSYCLHLIITKTGEGKFIMEDLRFDETIFFELILPLIIFPSGYNMRRKKFFKNIGTIMKFGFVGTIFCFALYTFLTWEALQLHLLQKTDADGNKVDLGMGMFEVLSLCALLCSSDVIAAISMINYSDQPKLFSIVYGEGVFNDIVSIILFNTVQGLKGKELSAKTPFEIIGQFILLAVASVGIGLVAGVFSSLLFKYFRFLCHSAITETLILLIIALMSYFFSEALEMSGIISLLTCGITMAHYTWFNLSPQGKTISSVTFSIFGSAAEAFVFSYIGLCTFTYAQSELDSPVSIWSSSFILWMTLIIIVGRLICVWFVHFLLKCCIKKDITLRELGFISYGGMIRGAIAFGLVLKISPDPDESGYVFAERDYVVTTTLAVVIITTVVFGSFMPVIQKILVPIQRKEGPNFDAAISPQPARQRDSTDTPRLDTTSQNEIQNNTRDEDAPMVQPRLSDLGDPISEMTEENRDESEAPVAQKFGQNHRKTSHYGSLKHPNMESDRESYVNNDLNNQLLANKAAPPKKKKKGCSFYFKKLDYEILRPILIYKYDRDVMHREDDFVEYLMNDNNIMGSIYGKMDPNVMKSNHEERITMALSRIFEKEKLAQSMRHTSANVGAHFKEQKFGQMAPNRQPFASLHYPRNTPNPYNNYGVAESQENNGGGDRGVLGDSRRSNQSLGMTQMSHNFNASFAKKFGQGGAKRSMAADGNSQHGSTYQANSPLKHTAIKPGDDLGQTSNTADMFMHISGDQKMFDPSLQPETELKRE